MRVISGKFRGRRLKAPEGVRTRPTSDRVREALFNILRDRIEGCEFLDAFAGTGAVGLEALSRGASRCVFVESGKEPSRVLAENIGLLQVEAQARVLYKSFARAAPLLAGELGPFDVVFLDPPYGPGEILRALRLVAGEGFLKPRGLLVAQHDSHLRLPDSEGRLAATRVSRYGNTTLSFFQVPPAD